MGGLVNVLAIETATPVCALGLSLEVGLTLSWVLDEDRRHTEVLAPGIERVLREFSLRARDLDRIVVDRGPGLFTGLRVGLATALALGAASGVEVVGVTSLEVLADGARRAGARGEVLVALDGRRGEVFYQSFALDESTSSALNEPAVARPEEVVEHCRRGGAPQWLTGDGVVRYRDVFARLEGVEIDPQTIPSLDAALELGARRTPTPVTPLYLRDADAVARFTTREGA